MQTARTRFVDNNNNKKNDVNVQHRSKSLVDKIKMFGEVSGEQKASRTCSTVRTPEQDWTRVHRVAVEPTNHCAMNSDWIQGVNLTVI